MPSSSALYNVDFVNLGALTTTFSAPAACATSNRIGMAHHDALGFPILFESCDPPVYGECLPNGNKLDEDAAKRYESHGLGNAIYYHQPASNCPESWTTAGIAARDANGKVSTSGIYGPPADVTTLPKVNPTPNIFIEALNPGETAIVCCPSGFTANEGVGCHSTMPMSSYTATDVCSTSAFEGNVVETVTFTYNGAVVTGVAPIESGSKPDQVSRVTAAPRETSVWQVASYIPAVTLVHGGVESSPQASNTFTTSKATGVPSCGGPRPTPVPGNGTHGDNDNGNGNSNGGNNSGSGEGGNSSNGGGGSSDNNGDGNGGNSGSDAGNGGSNGGAGGDVPFNAGNMRWGDLGKTATIAWGLAAAVSMLIAAV